MKGARIASDGRATHDLLKTALDAGAANEVMISLETPRGDSFAYAVVRNHELLELSRALPPIMAVHGARALANIAQALGDGVLIAVMRPCEINAAVELSKLEQIDLSHVVLLSTDCPGAVPLANYRDGSIQAPSWFDDETIRPVCRTCVSFAESGDVHVATLGLDNGNAVLVPRSEKGHQLLKDLNLQAVEDVSSWEKEVETLRARRSKARSDAFCTFSAEATGLERLTDFFSHCIGCHNCGSVCPICYCRQCYIDGQEWISEGSEHFERGQNAGAIRLHPHTLLYHVGRMAHMSLSCVSCGACEDACPAGIRIAQLFSMVAHETQSLFDYEPGADADAPVPFATYKEDELHAVEE